MKQKFNLKTVELLFIKMSEKCDRGLNYSNFKYFSKQINDKIDLSFNPFISHRYLYSKYSEIIKQKEEGETSVSINHAYLNAIAEYLGYNEFQAFEESQTSPPNKISPILLGCKGLWYSYVRCNSGRNDVLISPIEVYENEGKIWMKMRGPTNTYEGELLLKGSCLFCALDSGRNKLLYVTYKIGECLNAEALVGTFCGMTTAGDPIAGREVLERRMDYKELNEMYNERVHLKDKEEVTKYLDRRIAQYFDKYEDNYIKIINVSTFSLKDLVME